MGYTTTAEATEKVDKRLDVEFQRLCSPNVTTGKWKRLIGAVWSIDEAKSLIKYNMAWVKKNNLMTRRYRIVEAVYGEFSRSQK